MDHGTGLPASKHSEIYLKTMLNANWNYDVPVRIQNHIWGVSSFTGHCQAMAACPEPQGSTSQTEEGEATRKKAEQGHRHTASKPGFLGSSPAVCTRTPAQGNVISAIKSVTAGPRSPMHT